ncbi:MAG: tRNA-intron lyase [archaeon]|jgi:tRNA-intron endonuclease|nr:tRNA-intron lyase [archaeon]
MAELIQNKVIVDKKKVKDALIQKGFGEKDGKDLVLDLKEAVYLIEKEKIEVIHKEKKLSAKKLLAYASAREARFYSKYIVFKDLRDRGYCVKTGFKFGFEFRVYPRGKKAGEAHTERVVKVFTQDDRKGLIELSRMVRLAGNLKTQCTFAVVDSENDINYYFIERITP